MEVTANPIGLGYNMLLAQQTLRPERMLALLVWLGVLGWGLKRPPRVVSGAAVRSTAMIGP